MFWVHDGNVTVFHSRRCHVADCSILAPLNNSKLPWYLTSQCNHSCGYEKPRHSDLEIKNLDLHKAEDVLLVFLYGYECLAVTKRDTRTIDALNQWCLRKMIGIKWYHHVRYGDVRWTTTCGLNRDPAVFHCSTVPCNWKNLTGLTTLTLWRPLLPYEYRYKASCARLG